MDGRVFSGGPLAFKEQGDKLFVKLVGVLRLRHRWSSLENEFRVDGMSPAS